MAGPPRHLERRHASIREADDGVAALFAIIEALRTQNAQLEEALESRVAIEQAKGVLAERFEIRPDEAFLLLRRAARTRRTRLHDLCAQVVASRETPAEIVDVVDRLRTQA